MPSRTTKQLDVGDSAPDFELKDLAGHAFCLSQMLQNGPVALVFYKASCPTCQFTLPYVERIAAESQSRVLVISQDDAETTKEFLEHFGFHFNVAIDQHPYDVSTAYGLSYVPSLFLVGSDGIIQLSDYGFSKPALNSIAGHDLFRPDDGIPARRPG